MSGKARDTVFLAFGMTTAAIQYVAYAIWQVDPNLVLLSLSIGCMLGATVLSRLLDALLSRIFGVKLNDPPNNRNDDDDE
jgi:hypothetical protein